MRDNSNEKTGYRRPPKHTQFKKGQSGNRKGRRKESKNLATIITRMLDERITVTVDGKRESMLIRDSLARRLSDLAASGSVKHIALLEALKYLDREEPILVIFEDGDQTL